MDKKKAFEILKNDGHENVVLIEKEANYFLDKHSHDFSVDLIILSLLLKSILTFLFSFSFFLTMSLISPSIP